MEYSLPFCSTNHRAHFHFPLFQTTNQNNLTMTGGKVIAGNAAIFHVLVDVPVGWVDFDVEMSGSSQDMTDSE